MLTASEATQGIGPVLLTMEDFYELGLGPKVGISSLFAVSPRTRRVIVLFARADASCTSLQCAQEVPILSKRAEEAAKVMKKR